MKHNTQKCTHMHKQTVTNVMKQTVQAMKSSADAIVVQRSGFNICHLEELSLIL